ncbi:MAG: hypothetical protein WC444_06635 [Candidatus Paceibacterota bacterium]
MTYARDIKPEYLTDTFFGKGFEAKLKKAEKNEKDLEVGIFFNVRDMKEV